MIITIRSKTYHVALRWRKKRDFDKERKEREVWRHPYPHPLHGLP